MARVAHFHPSMFTGELQEKLQNFLPGRKRKPKKGTTVSEAAVGEPGDEGPPSSGSPGLLPGIVPGPQVGRITVSSSLYNPSVQQRGQRRPTLLTHRGYI